MRKPQDVTTDAGRVFDAIGNGDVERVRTLLAQDATFAAARATHDRLFARIPHWLYEGDTPLHLACAALERDVVELLIAARADAAAVNRRGAMPLHYACDPRPGGGVWDPPRQVAIIDALVDAGAPVNAADDGGATPLHRAVRARSAAAVRALLAHRADARARNSGGSTPLHLAVTASGASGTVGARDAQLDIIRALLEHGARIDDADARRRTVLDAARNAAIRQLLESAAVQ